MPGDMINTFLFQLSILPLFNNFQIAQHCYKQTQNFLSMFAIISGLQNRAVTRLKETWKAVPQRYIKIKDDISMIMDPSMNFRKYRNLINNTKVEIRFELFHYLPLNIKTNHLMDVDCILNTFVLATKNTNIPNGVQRPDIY